MRILTASNRAAARLRLAERPARAAAIIRRLACLVAALLALAPASQGASQQFVTDDAGVVEARACQLEAWHGQASSWILPACHFIPSLELTAGIGFVAEDVDRHIEYVLQGKYLFREVAPGQVGIGLVAGIGYDPQAQIGEGVEGAFAYVPVSVSLGDDRVVLHGNLGWSVHRDGHTHEHHEAGSPRTDSHHALTWAARSDLLLPGLADRFTLIGEIFGENRLRPEVQVGLRTALVPDLVLVDLSYGAHTEPRLGGAGWTIGIALTPPAFF